MFGLTDQMIEKSMSTFDQYLLNCFANIGISEQEVYDNSRIITCDCYADPEHNATYRRYFRDGRYLFTIVISSDFESYDCGCKYVTTYDCIFEKNSREGLRRKQNEYEYINVSRNNARIRCS